MSDQPNDRGRSDQSTTDQKTSERWEKMLVGKEVDAQTQSSNNYSAAIQRWAQESSVDAPWNAIGYFQQIPLTTKEETGQEQTSTTGATAGSETSGSKK